MARLGPTRWGKSSVRISKIHRSGDGDDFSELEVQILLQGEVAAAYTDGDNSAVLPTDTMKNTVYALAQDALGRDLEAFAKVVCDHFLERDDVDGATVSIAERLWSRHDAHGFTGGGSERRTARVARAEETTTWGGVDGLVVLKTTGSAFSGFPHDRFTVLPETDDRILATSVTATWRYAQLPDDTTAAWNAARSALIDRFFGEWSASVQHQGWLMGIALLDSVPEAAEVELRLPNQHHLPFDLSRFGIDDRGVVFQPVSEPYGDISLTVTR